MSSEELEKAFDEWFSANKERFHQVQFTEKQIARAAFDEGVRAGRPPTGWHDVDEFYKDE